MARAKAGRVEFFEGLTVGKLRELYRRHNRGICGEAAYWRAKKHSRYGTLIWLTDVEATDCGPAMEPSRGPAWFVLGEGEPVSGDLGHAVRSPSHPTRVVESGGGPDAHPTAKLLATRGRAFEVALTAGAIRNRYVTLPAEVAARLRSREVTLRLPDGREVATGLVGSRLRWRGWGGYFRRFGVRSSTVVRFTPAGPSNFVVSFAASKTSVL
jgi:hypothetical protein